MSRDKSRRDIISEKQFNAHGLSTHNTPEQDSPADSEQGAGEEFLMGLNYMPGEEDEFEDVGDEPGEIIFSENNTSPNTLSRTLDKNAVQLSRKKIPENAKVESSDMPTPWQRTRNTGGKVE